MVTCEIKEFNEEQEARDVFRNMKLDYDKARLQLIDYKLGDIIADYQKLKELREDIQEKFFSVIELICENELDDEISMLMNGKRYEIMKMLIGILN